jgi:hypothetical protein
MTTDTALAVGSTALVVAAQFRTRRVRALAYVWMVLLVARGCVPPGPSRPTAVSIALLLVSLLVSAAFGVLRGRTMPMWRAGDAAVYRRGDRTTLLLWLATIATKIGMVVAAQEWLAEPVNLNALWLGLGVTVAVQQYVLLRRAGGPASSQRSVYGGRSSVTKIVDGN